MGRAWDDEGTTARIADLIAAEIDAFDASTRAARMTLAAF